MDKVTIPPEVVLSMRPHICPYICGPDVVCRVCKNRALAAARAMLGTWPGAEYCSLIVLSDRNFCGFLLPLPQKENSNADR
jgi:hypothetical protein